MRLLAVLSLVFAALWAGAQQPQPGEAPESEDPGAPTTQDLIGTMPAPQISITIRKHSGHIDYVNLTVVKAGYPEELLREQLARLGELLGSEPRGLQIGQVMIDENKKLSFLRSAFAIDGLIEPTTRKFELNTIIRAFLGAEEPNTVTSLQINFENETPVPNRTLDKYSDDKVTIVGNIYNSPKSIEYRVLVNTQNPEEINIPLDMPAKAEKSTSPMGPARPTPLIIGIIVIAGVALGALVYFVMLRSPKS